MPEENKEIPVEILAQASDWVENADMFFSGAENLIGIERSAIPKMACLMAQATAERYLKSFLVLNQHEYRKYGHDLPAIIGACAKIDADFNALISLGENLNVYRRQLNYPDMHTTPTSVSEREAMEAIEYTREIRDFVLKKLKELGYKDTT